MTFITTKGIEMVNGSAIEFRVPSSLDPKTMYTVRLSPDESAMECTCKGYFYRKNCKHLTEVRIFRRDVLKQVMNTTVNEEEEKLKESPAGIVKDTDGVDVLVSLDDAGVKSLWVRSSVDTIGDQPAWIPRRKLPHLDRKKLLKECLEMENIFIPVHRISEEDFLKMTDSDLFIYHRMIHELHQVHS